MTFAFASYFFIPAAFFISEIFSNKKTNQSPKKANNSKNLTISLLCGVTSVLAILISDSRSGQAALVVSFVFTYLIGFGLSRSIKMLIFSKYTIFILLFFTTLLYVFFIYKPIYSDGVLTASSYSRLQLNAATFNIFKKAPIFGIGSGQVADIIENYLEDLESVTDRLPHNLFLSLLSENGITGLILFLAPFLFVIIKIAKKIWLRKNKSTPFFKSYFFVICFFIMFFFDSMFHNTENNNMIWIVLGFAVAILQKKL